MKSHCEMLEKKKKTQRSNVPLLFLGSTMMCCWGRKKRENSFFWVHCSFLADTLSITLRKEIQQSTKIKIPGKLVREKSFVQFWNTWKISFTLRLTDALVVVVEVSHFLFLKKKSKLPRKWEPLLQKKLTCNISLKKYTHSTGGKKSLKSSIPFLSHT